MVTSNKPAVVMLKNWLMGYVGFLISVKWVFGLSLDVTGRRP
jgi:hypothetical protein